jgi:hypothetical protein
VGIAHLLADAQHGFVRVGRHAPFGRTRADPVEEVLEDRRAVFECVTSGMELNTPKRTRRRALRRRSCRWTSRRSTSNRRGRLRLDRRGSSKRPAERGVPSNNAASEPTASSRWPNSRSLPGTTRHPVRWASSLHPVADPEDGHAEIEDLRVEGRSPGS